MINIDEKPNIEQLIGEIQTKFISMSCEGLTIEPKSAEKMLRDINYSNFRSGQGALLYLMGGREYVVALSFNQPVWAHKSVTKKNDWQKHYAKNPDHILQLLTQKQATASQDVYRTAAYTGGLIGIMGHIEVERERADFHISPFEYLFGAQNASKVDGCREAHGAGPDVSWVISVPSEVIADFRILSSVNQMRKVFFPEEYK